MKIDFVTIADIHWDALESSKQFEEMGFVLEFIDNVPHLDLVVIAGDYFDTKLLLNSKTSIRAIKWMSILVAICKKRNIKIRIVKGTASHDNNQLDAFDGYEKEDPEFFRIYRNCSAEEVLPDFHCLFCPDENIATKDYLLTYGDIFRAQKYDVMFFHGSFDVVVPDIALQESEIEGLKNVIFPYSYFEKVCRVLIGGHWHDGNTYKHMSYTRSVSRWAFNEDKPKGFIYTTYDTDNKTYLNQRIENPYTDSYFTFLVDTRSMANIDAYRMLMDEVDRKLDNPTMHVRIKIVVNDDKSENLNYLTMLKHKYMNNTRRVKIVVKNNLTEKKKKEELKRSHEMQEKYNFVRDKSKKPAEIIQEFIFVTKHKELPIDTIRHFTDKYLTE